MVEIERRMQMGEREVEQMREVLVDWMRPVIEEMFEDLPELKQQALENLERDRLRKPEDR